MPRITVSDVRDAIETSLPDSEIASYIEDAALEVTERHAAAADVEYSDQRLERLEKYLAAHLIRFLRERQEEQTTVGHGSARYTREFSGAFGEGLRATAPGQTVLALDRDGLFADDLDSRTSTRSGYVRSTRKQRRVESAEEPL